jgi:hypothetical protein
MRKAMHLLLLIAEGKPHEPRKDLLLKNPVCIVNVFLHDAYGYRTALK